MSTQRLPASFNAIPDHSYPLAGVADGAQLNGVVGTSETLSFEALFRRYREALCALARTYVKCRDLAEEVVEEVFLHVWEMGGSWPECVNPKRYLYTAVRNQALKHLEHDCVVRRSHALAKAQGRTPGMSQTPTTAEDEVQAIELAAAFERAMGQLPARCREAYTLYRERGMSYAEIAQVMGTSARTVETQLARAHRTLRHELEAWL